jgi:predicted nucleotidyltransferase
MRRAEVLATLRAHEAELHDAEVVALSDFGSVARDDAGAASKPWQRG